MNFEVQVRTSGLATVSDGRNLLSGNDPLADVHRVIIDVAVHRRCSVVVQQLHPQSEAGYRAGIDNLAVGRRLPNSATQGAFLVTCFLSFLHHRL